MLRVFTQIQIQIQFHLRRGIKNLMFTQKLYMLFIAARLIIAKTWKQPRYPSVGEWTNRYGYIQTMEYYSALRRNELSDHKKTQKKLKGILPSDKSQSEKATYCMISST